MANIGETITEVDIPEDEPIEFPAEASGDRTGRGAGPRTGGASWATGSGRSAMAGSDPLTRSGNWTAWTIGTVEAGTHYPNLGGAAAPRVWRCGSKWWECGDGAVGPPTTPRTETRTAPAGCTPSTRRSIYWTEIGPHPQEWLLNVYFRHFIAGVVALSGHTIIHKKGLPSCEAQIRAIYDVGHQVSGIYDDVARTPTST
jgi:hypothetical protein